MPNVAGTVFDENGPTFCLEKIVDRLGHVNWLNVRKVNNRYIYLGSSSKESDILEFFEDRNNI